MSSQNAARVGESARCLAVGGVRPLAAEARRPDGLTELRVEPMALNSTIQTDTSEKRTGAA
jgi:hypothetical protein